jgi:hypothetical protein
MNADVHTHLDPSSIDTASLEWLTDGVARAYARPVGEQPEPVERANALMFARSLLELADADDVPLATIVAGVNVIAAAALVHMDRHLSRQEVRERVLFTRRERFDGYVDKLRGLFMALLGPSADDLPPRPDLRPAEASTTRSA